METAPSRDPAQARATYLCFVHGRKGTMSPMKCARDARLGEIQAKITVTTDLNSRTGRL